MSKPVEFSLIVLFALLVLGVLIVIKVDHEQNHRHEVTDEDFLRSCKAVDFLPDQCLFFRYGPKWQEHKS